MRGREDSDYRQLFLGSVAAKGKKNGGSYQKTVESGEVFSQMGEITIWLISSGSLNSIMTSRIHRENLIKYYCWCLVRTESREGGRR